MDTQNASDKQHEKTVDISIDGDDYVAPMKEMAADDILRLASIDPTQNYLVEKHGREQTSYKDKGSTLVKLHEHETFISVPTGDATVS
jgi:hypothetical protein